MRIEQHPILGPAKQAKPVAIEVDGKKIPAFEGEPIAAALLAVGIMVFRETAKYHEPRGLFCATGQCTDCMMTVNGKPNVRTCVTPVRAGLKVKTQKGLGKWNKGDD